MKVRIYLTGEHSYKVRVFLFRAFKKDFWISLGRKTDKFNGFVDVPLDILGVLPVNFEVGEFGRFVISFDDVENILKAEVKAYNVSLADFSVDLDDEIDGKVIDIPKINLVKGSWVVGQIRFDVLD
jgi:hypothetical protein